MPGKQYKIYISPSLQPANRYADGSGSEQNHMQAVGRKVVDLLKRHSEFEVFCNRVGMTMKEAVEESNSIGVDAHVAIHSNAGGGDGSLALYYPGSHNGEMLARAIYEKVSPISPGKDDGVRSDASLYELRKTKAPATIIEVEFHDNKELAAWIGSHYQELAYAIYSGICNYFGIDAEGDELSLFKDVKPKKWYAKAVEEAARLGLMVGTAPGIFEPDKPVTRAELAAVAVRLYKATNEDFVEVVHKVLPAVVQVENFESGSLGSGTIIQADGYVLTNYHVVAKTVQEEGKEPVKTVAKRVGFRTTELPWSYAEGPVVDYDEEKDLAICKIELDGPFPSLPFGNFNNVSKAQKVMAIGSPLGLIQSVSEGVVSGIRTGLVRPGDVFIQTEAEINPGNSGGALVNLDGHLIGVPSLKLSGVGIEGLNFAIGLPTVTQFLEEKGYTLMRRN